jgi:hypothetical protein
MVFRKGRGGLGLGMGFGRAIADVRRWRGSFERIHRFLSTMGHL